MENIAFMEKVGTYQSSLRSYAIHFTQNTEDANDLIQETLYKALKYSNLYQDGTNLKAWLFTILRNTFINNYRRNIKKRSLIHTSDDIHSSQLLKSSMRNEGEKTFLVNDIFKALNKLEPAYRVPFMRFFEGYKYYEIADELNIPIGTVKTRIHVARKVLKKALKMYTDTNQLPAY
jgi:RNA polymerase sigma factor (sigma-70 family)